MPTRRRVRAWLAWALMIPAAAGAQDLTDRELVDLILREGGQARAIRASVEVTRREQLARTAFPNPAVGYLREGAGFTEFLQFEQSLPIFGTRAALTRAGVAATAAAEAERDARLWLLRGEAQTTVARLMAEQARLEASLTTVRDMERILELLLIREREGEGSRFDRVRAEQELAETRQIVVEAAAGAAEARAAISALLDAGGRLSRVTGTLFVERAIPAVETLTARAASGRAELRALQAAADRFQFEAAAARRTRLPAPIVMGGMKRADAGEGREVGGIFGVNLSLALFDSGRREAARWTAERARAEAERAAMIQNIQAQIAGAREVLALRQTAVMTAGTSSSEELTRIAELAFREGEIGIFELLDAHRAVARARRRAIELRLGARQAQIALERAVGDTLWP